MSGTGRGRGRFRGRWGAGPRDELCGVKRELRGLAASQAVRQYWDGGDGPAGSGMAAWAFHSLHIFCGLGKAKRWLGLSIIAGCPSLPGKGLCFWKGGCAWRAAKRRRMPAPALLPLNGVRALP